MSTEYDMLKLIESMKSLDTTTNYLNDTLKKAEEHLQKVFSNLEKSLNKISSIPANKNDQSNSGDKQINPRLKELQERVVETKKLSDGEDTVIKYPQSNSEAVEGALYKVKNEFGDTYKNLQTLTYSAALSMRNSFNDFFFDAMTGKLKTAGEYFKSFFTSIQKAMATFLANKITNGIIESIFGKQDVTKKAKGGRASAGDMLVVGESGPELLSLDGSGATIISNNTTESMLGGATNIAVEVNVINQSGTQMQASQGETRFDGQKYVVDVFMDAWARDVSGLRTAVAGRR